MYLQPLDRPLIHAVIALSPAGIRIHRFYDIRHRIVIPAWEEVIIDPDGEEDIGINILPCLLPPHPIIFLLEGSLDLAVDGRTREGGFGGDQHELIVLPDSLINLAPQGFSSFRVFIPL